MENFIMWLSNSFYNIIMALTTSTIDIIEWTLEGTVNLNDLNINLVLFSETPILTTNLYNLLTIVFAISYTVIFVVIVYKIIKKVLVKLTGWSKW